MIGFIFLLFFYARTSGYFTKVCYFISSWFSLPVSIHILCFLSKYIQAFMHSFFLPSSCSVSVNICSTCSKSGIATKSESSEKNQAIFCSVRAKAGEKERFFKKSKKIREVLSCVIFYFRTMPFLILNHTFS